MEMQQLRYFVSIYNCKSLTKAAEESHISVQGISLSINRLEAELGEGLFVRSSKGIAPTEYADYLYPRAKKILATKDECIDYFASHKHQKEVCKISLAQGAIEEFVGPVLKEFKDKYPDVKVDIHEATDRLCEDDIIYGTTEMAVLVGPVNNKSFDAVELLRRRHALITQADGPYANRDSISISDIKDIPITILDSENRTNSILGNLCEREGFELNIEFLSAYVLSLFTVVKNGLMSGVVTESLARRNAGENLKIIPIDSDEYIWRLYLIRQKNKKLSKYARALWDMLAEKAKVNPEK